MTTKPKPHHYLLGYLLIIACASLMPWRELDWRITNFLLPPQALKDDIVFVGIPSPRVIAAEELLAYRENIARLLGSLKSDGSGLPKAVILDVKFGPDKTGLPQLTRAIQDLQEKQVKVYAAVNPRHAEESGFNADYMDEHLAPLYTDVLDGFGHTYFEWLGATLKFDPYIELGSSVSIPALAVKVAQDLAEYPVNPDQRSVVLQAGNREDFKRQSFLFDSGKLLRPGELSGSEAPPNFQGKFVIVGNPEEVPSPANFPKELQRSGPEFLTWALSACLSRDTPELKAEPWLLVSYLLGLSGLSAYLTRSLFLRLPALRVHAPGLAPAAGAMVSLQGFGVSVWGLREMKLVYPLVTLVVIGVVASSVLTALYLRKMRAYATENLEQTEEITAFDVFVSYAHSHPLHIAWVETNVANLLRQQVRKPDGSPITVFFDKESIRPGDDWAPRLAEAITDSRVFVAVYSDDYFSRTVCKYEFETAYTRRVQDRLAIIPLMRSTKPDLVPDEYQGMSYIDANSDPKFREQLIKAVRAQIHEVESKALLGQDKLAGAV